MGEADEYLYRVNAKLLGQASGVQIKRGDLIPQQALDEHAISIGLPAPKVRVGAYEDLLLTRNGVQAFGFGSHFQYVTRKRVIQEAGPLGVGTSGLSKAERKWDERLAELGYLRLALEKPLVYHMGNTLVGENVEELRRLSHVEVPVNSESKERPRDALASFFALFARIKWLKRLLQRIQRSLFEALTFRT